MSRTSFAIAFPLILAVVVVLLGGYAIGMAFQGEGCRFARTGEAVWAAVKDLLIAQLVFGCLLALLVGMLVSVLRQRFQDLGLSLGVARWIVGLASVAFGSATLMVLILQGLCSRGGALAAVAGLSGVVSGVSVLTAFVLALWAFAQGLASGPKPRI